METIICDTTAFMYWRTPPIVRLLAAGPEDDVLLSRLTTEGRLHAMRERLAATTPLSLAFQRPEGSWTCCGTRTRAVRDAHRLLVPCVSGTVDILVQSVSEQRANSLVRPRLWSAEIPLGSTVQIAEDLLVARPELALQQIAARSSPVCVLMMATELCGSFTVYCAPPAIRAELQWISDNRGIPCVEGWSPCVTKGGKLTDLWRREPLTTPEEIAGFVQVSDARNGRAKLAEAARLVVPGAASPLEAQVGIALGLSRRRGGEGLAGFAHNKRIQLSGTARLLAQRECLYADIFYEEGLDVECQSTLWHDDATGFLSDSDRTAALECMHVRVIPVTAALIASHERTEALARVISQIREMPYRKKTATQAAASLALRNDLLVNWGSLPFMGSR